jgi:hypothetical protein
MTKKLLFVLSVFCAFAFSALAAGIDGKWTAEQPGRQGGAPTVSTYTFKSDGSKLTGSVSRPGRGGDPTTTEITDGKIDGNNVSFKITTNMGGQDRTTEYKGTLDGDSLTLKFMAPGRGGAEPTERTVVAKRATT